MKYDKATVTCNRIAINPCASDEYEVVVEPNDGQREVFHTFGGVFESDESICNRIYLEWQAKNEQ